ncbi:MAG: COG1470 family protein [Candidatus Bathyarchaeia archaeon]
MINIYEVGGPPTGKVPPSQPAESAAPPIPYLYRVYSRTPPPGRGGVPSGSYYPPPRSRPAPAYYPRPSRQPLRILLLAILFAGLLLTSTALLFLFIYRPPSITHTPVSQGLANSPVSLNATIVGGGTWLQNATLRYNIVSEGVWKEKPMELPPTGIQPYVAVIPGVEVKSDIVYYIEAVNSLGLSVNTRAYFIQVKNFKISTEASRLVFSAGYGNRTVVTVGSFRGFSSTVSLAIAGLPSGVTATFNPPTVTPPPDGLATSTLTFSSVTSAPPGIYTVTVTGWSGNLTHTCSLTIKINPPRDFEISVIPTSIEIRRGSAAYYNVTLTARNGYSGDVNLQVSGLPTGGFGGGVRYTFTTCRNTTSLAGTVQRLVLVISTTPLSPLGTFNLTITASDGVLTHTAGITLNVRPEFG